MTLPSIKNSFRPNLLLAIILIAALYSCKKNDLPTAESVDALDQKANLSNKPAEESADVVHRWYRLMGTMQLNAAPQPVVLLNYRSFGFIGVGVYEAVQPGIRGARSLSTELYQMPKMPKPDMSKDYLWGAAANAAMASMFKQFLTGLSPANIASINAREIENYNQFKLTSSEDVLMRSQAFGRAIADAIYSWSTTDNFNLSSVGYIFPPPSPSAWVPTPPGFAAPVGAFLKDSRPFLEYSLTATAPPLPIPFSVEQGSAFYLAAKEVYDVGQALSNEQKAIANWWADAGGTGVGLAAPYHLMSIVTTVLENRHANLWKAAEVYAKASMGMKDGPIITFRAKFQYDLIRPVTYIRRHIQPPSPAWNSFLTSPPYPEYTSGLVSNYGPVIQVLIREVGDVPVIDNAYAFRGLAARHYTSLSQLLTEAARSRVYGGLHYQFTQDVSVDMGKELGDQIANVQIVGPKY